ncbi:PCI domain-containing protein 2 homolog [Eumeta japonica]|uniref:PCI domain-containing protein 2 homolog n=1 Tax=Eumeta variegata TaxID=151549 RepID=A0A4C1W9Y4_EUMVA|nr:PCI domain-containing protein 2 homolog [Eumeta japonica]
MFRTGQGDILARLLSLRDEHVANRNLLSCDIVALVDGNCMAPVDEIVIAHLLCVKALYAHDYLNAYAQQRDCVSAVVRLLQSQKEENWSLPLMYTVCLDLRLVAQTAEVMDAQCNGQILEKAAECLLACFRVCAADNRSSDADTKRHGMLSLVNQLLKVYFRINKLHLCKPLIRAIDSSPLKDQFPLAQQITYRYFVGRKAMFDSDYRQADEYLTFAFQNSHRDAVKNKRLILTYLVPVKMLLGFMPSKKLLQKYDLLQFWDLVETVKNGDLRGIDSVMEQHEQFFIKAGIYLIVEKLKITAYRNLFRKVYLVENTHQIDIASFQAALHLMGQEDVDSDETQCIVANLIYDGKIKGYISYQHKKVVDTERPTQRVRESAILIVFLRAAFRSVGLRACTSECGTVKCHREATVSYVRSSRVLAPANCTVYTPSPRPVSAPRGVFRPCESDTPRALVRTDCPLRVFPLLPLRTGRITKKSCVRCSCTTAATYEAYAEYRN